MFILLALLLLAPYARAAHPGEKIFDAQGCRACHRVGQKGGNSGPDLSFVGFRRSRAWLDRWLENPRAWKPDTRMPRPGLSDGDRVGLLDYLTSLRGETLARRPPWDGPGLRVDPLKRGKLIFAKVGCAACHGAAGRGGHPNNNVAGGQIPRLDKVKEGFTFEELKDRVRRGRVPERADPSGPDPLVVMPAWGEVLSEDAIAAVSSYLMSLGGASSTEW